MPKITIYINVLLLKRHILLDNLTGYQEIRDNMRICYFGTYEKDYPRNRVLIEGLKKAGVEVIECHVPLWEKKRDKTRWGFFEKIGVMARLPSVYIKLNSDLKKLEKKGSFDCIIIGYIGQLDMIAAHFAAGRSRTKLIFNPMISLYDTLVNDRKMFKDPITRRLLHWLDWKSCSYADLVVLDTEEHARYFRKEFGIRNVGVLYIGADEMFRPSARDKKEKDIFNVLFYGKYTPLHGTEYIIKSAKLLEKHDDMRFEIIGTGQTYRHDMETAKKLGIRNVRFTDWVDYKKLPGKIAEADVCLGGHFGQGEKALRVVPNKVFQIIAMAKPAVVNGGDAMREAGFSDGKNCVFARPADPGSISRAILKLKDDDELKDRIAAGGYELYRKNFSPEKIAKKLLDDIKKMGNGR
ncbi:hypothetical protein COV19_05630 [Candidatus Woesearchaeota archaeon CG10_big_fil_rev_8_21_14_0_10_44_13]|nr:MAG: hypothetical protein COV19_05630 [Candidatus Woesearchaeota archaeon CG10_big_fil_rev_8_21_14_0_10_44_13]